MKQIHSMVVPVLVLYRYNESPFQPADRKPPPPRVHSKLSPSAHLTSEQPALTVSLTAYGLPCSLICGLTSTCMQIHQHRSHCFSERESRNEKHTRSIATSAPDSCTHSQIKSPSRSVNPPLTGVPVLGAHIGSRASTSKLR